MEAEASTKAEIEAILQAGLHATGIDVRVGPGDVVPEGVTIEVFTDADSFITGRDQHMAPPAMTSLIRLMHSSLCDYYAAFRGLSRAPGYLTREFVSPRNTTRTSGSR